MNPSQNITSRAEINNTVWKACDTFRGVVDPSQYKDYILTMLFLKYLSDVWKDKKETWREKYKGDEDRVNRALGRERFAVPKECTFDHLFQHRSAPNLGELINMAFEGLEEANRSKLEGVFRNIDFNSEKDLGETKDRNRRLKNLLTDFQPLDLRPSQTGDGDIIGDAYEYLIERFAADSGKKAGEFYTPSAVSTLLAKLVRPESGMRICDPTCGSGSLLIKVAREVPDRNFSLYGQEVNGATYALCRMNMFLHEMDQARIERGDTLNNPRLLEGDALRKFDIVVANPPFSLDKWKGDKTDNDPYDRFRRGVPPKSRGDYAFISHMIETTYADHGRVGVILPHGVLFRGSSEGKIRRQLIEENLLEAVVGLPANLFFGTGIPACILIFNRGKGQNRDVCFIDASRDFVQGKNQNELGEAQIERILAEYARFRSEAPCDTEEGRVMTDKYSYRATPEELTDNDFNLNIPRYVDTFEEEAPVDVPATVARIAELRQELDAVQAQMQTYLDQLGY